MRTEDIFQLANLIQVFIGTKDSLQNSILDIMSFDSFEANPIYTVTVDIGEVLIQNLGPLFFILNYHIGC